ncbi:hypothetical protein [Lysobacter sp.]|uniref:hypothetical protein n=1 Tax=Lysobacter sp. TaxID=72226 RepID=UPI002D26C999|nr:hypothetical protein [Lysobacter sp.]HZX77995.1 hypothetical protein [Lysobacter sp.]
MAEDIDDTGTMQALLERLLNFRLPRAMALKKRVDAGERLTDADIAFLKSALEDAQDGQKFVARNAEFHDLGIRIVQLYEEIVRKATENEKRA